MNGKILYVLGGLVAILMVMYLIVTIGKAQGKLPDYRVITNGQTYKVQQRFFISYTDTLITTNEDMAIALFSTYQHPVVDKSPWIVVTNSNY